MRAYIVRKDAWYTERATWGVAGVVISSATALAAVVHPAFAGLITLTGLFSWLTAATGYDPVSTLLRHAGMPSYLGGWAPGPFGTRIYRMRTDSWFLERGIYAVVGTTQTLGSVLAVAHHPAWLGFTGFVGLMSIGFSLSGFCPVANALYFLGFEPRLAPVGEAHDGAPAAAPTPVVA
jgi:hypothetical protein